MASMLAYCAKRLLTGVLVLWLISVLVFSMVRLLPGDAITALMAQSGVSNPQREAELRHQLGFDRPALAQYLTWSGKLLRGDPGVSIWSGQSIAHSLADTVPVTLELAVMALVIGLLIAIPIGVLSAIRQDTPIDYAARIFSILGVSIPDFLLGSLLLAWLISQFSWAPPIVYVSPFEDPIANLTQYILPALVLGYRLSATTMRMTRSTMLEILREDYIRTAWSKGLREKAVVIRHAMRNALIPVVTIIGLQAGYLLAGSVVVETVFNLPGMGRLLVQAIGVRDYPQIQAFVLLVGAVMILVNLIVDLSYTVLDPRVRTA